MTSTGFHQRREAPAFDVVVLAASLGGLPVIRQVLARLPIDFQAAIVTILHSGPSSPRLLASIFGESSALPVTYAENGMVLRPSHVTVAPPDMHLQFDRSRRCRLTKSAKISYARPSADVLLTSCAERFGERTLAAVLTGRLSDGAAGANAVHAAGGVVIAQDPRTCVAPGMPNATIAMNAATFVLPPIAIPDAIWSLVSVAGVREVLGLRRPAA